MAGGFRIFQGVIALGFVAASFVMLRGALEARPLTDLATVLERTSTLPTISPENIERVMDKLSVHDGCDRTVSRSRVTATLFLLRRALADGEGLDVRLQRFVDARDAVTHGLVCSPMDGNLWTLSAALGVAEAFEAESFLARIEMSRRTAPHEGPILYARWQLLAPLMGTPGLALDDATMEDLMAAVTLGKSAHGRHLVGLLERSVGEEAVTRMTAGLSEEIRLKLVPSGERPSMPSLKDRYRKFEFDVF